MFTREARDFSVKSSFSVVKTHWKKNIHRPISSFILFTLPALSCEWHNCNFTAYNFETTHQQNYWRAACPLCQNNISSCQISISLFRSSPQADHVQGRSADFFFPPSFHFNHPRPCWESAREKASV